jgi:hypothetical protein
VRQSAWVAAQQAAGTQSHALQTPSVSCKDAFTTLWCSWCRAPAQQQHSGASSALGCTLITDMGSQERGARRAATLAAERLCPPSPHLGDELGCRAFEAKAWQATLVQGRVLSVARERRSWQASRSLAARSCNACIPKGCMPSSCCTLWHPCCRKHCALHESCRQQQCTELIDVCSVHGCMVVYNPDYNPEQL